MSGRVRTRPPKELQPVAKSAGLFRWDIIAQNKIQSGLVMHDSLTEAATKEEAIAEFEMQNPTYKVTEIEPL